MILRFVVLKRKPPCLPQATPLFIACQHGHMAAALLLLDLGADLRKGTHVGVSPLHVACAGGHAGDTGLACLLQSRDPPRLSDTA